MRSGLLVSHPTGYKAFIPKSLPPKPPIKMDDLNQLLSDANIAMGRLDTMGYLLPNVDQIIAMYVRKEALLSSQIEGTQASLEDIFEYESHIPVKNIHDVQEVVNSSPLAVALLDYLFIKPHVSIQEVAEHFQISYPTSQALIKQFVDIGILKEITGKKRDRRFSYWEFLDCLSEGTSI